MSWSCMPLGSNKVIVKFPKMLKIKFKLNNCVCHAEYTKIEFIIAYNQMYTMSFDGQKRKFKFNTS